MASEHEIRCTNAKCPSRKHIERGALACKVEDHEAHITIVWRCRRCKRQQRAPLPKL